MRGSGKAEEKKYMKMAISIALKGLGNTSPNPMVGALIVKGGRVLAKGFHAKAGGSHAEISALKKAGRGAKGSDMYVTLEPCNHTGRTPPCSDALIEAGIRRVFVGAVDPNPLVSGKGLDKLRRAGIETITGILETECIKLNEAYNKFIISGIPFVTLKLASSLDGKIAAPDGASMWITGNESRKRVHKMRATYDAVMVGVGTVLRDDPSLTTRYVRGRNPLKVIVDSRLRIPGTASVFRSGGEVVLACTPAADRERIKSFQMRDRATVIVTPSCDERVDLIKLSEILAKRGVTSIMIEGGMRLAAAAIKMQIVDKFLFFYAPRIIGGDGISMVGDLSINSLDDCPMLSEVSISRLGDDFLLEGYSACLRAL